MKPLSFVYPLAMVALVGGLVWFAMLPREPAWQTFELPQSGCTLEMPGIPKPRDEEIVAVRGTKTLAKGLDLTRRDVPARFFVLEYSIAKAPKGPEFVLDEICLSVLSQMEGEKPAGKSIKLGEHPGRSLDFEFRDAEGHHRHQARVYHVRDRYVYLAVTAPADLAEADSFRQDVRRFFDSLQVAPKPITEPP